MSIETISSNHSFGGTQSVHKHASSATGTDMTFSVFVPDHAPRTKLPVVWYLSGLTCTHANVTEKGEYRRACAELGLIFVAPDTSPRGDTVPDDTAGRMISDLVRASTSMRPRSRSISITKCAVTSKMNCRKSSLPISRPI
jgi:S-formylglutathione hydrolase FrmB